MCMLCTVYLSRDLNIRDPRLRAANQSLQAGHPQLKTEAVVTITDLLH